MTRVANRKTFMNHAQTGAVMVAKIINFISKVDENEYEILMEALNLYDDYLHSQDSLKEVIKVRELVHKIKSARERRYSDKRSNK